MLTALRVVLHPYYKLAYIKVAWGGAEEQAAEKAAGNLYAKNWQDEAQKVLETEVIHINLSIYLSIFVTDKFQMEKYWMNRPRSSPITTSTPSNDVVGSASVMSDFDRYRRSLVALEEDEGWQSELRRYLKDMPADVTAETDIIRYWQVCSFNLLLLYLKFHIAMTYRTITDSIPPSDALHLTFSQFLRLPFLANVFFLLPRKLPTIVVRVWVQQSSRNSSS